uniref:Protein YIF1 n=1 Tax=Timema douglasi TaxID=61478 RepID=A0A7R8VXM2_TIMDO|nr:unnamed protein product [Timema douglasi]
MLTTTAITCVIPRMVPPSLITFSHMQTLEFLQSNVQRIIFAVLLSLVFQRTGYFIGLIYSSVSLAFFLLRTLKVQVLLDTTSSPHDPYRGDSSSAMVGNKRRLYILLFIAGIQPVLMWWLSYHLTTADVVT